jgi:hypothetical protein
MKIVRRALQTKTKKTAQFPVICVSDHPSLPNDEEKKPWEKEHEHVGSCSPTAAANIMLDMHTSP